jgi:hypothetical protein
MKRSALLSLLLLALLATPAAATPVCTDGYMGGPPAEQCGGRIFPEAERAQAYVQYSPNPLGFIEYQHGIEYLAQKYPRWVSVFTLRERYGGDAVSAGPDAVRPTEGADEGDGRDIQVIKITDHRVPDEGKETLLFSLSVHGNERGGLEGGLRTAEDLAIAAEEGGTLVDGIDNYASSTGRKARFHELEVRELLAEEAVYLVDFNPDGWAVGDFWNPPAPSLYSRGNSVGTDLNRQMPTVGRINPGRNPLQESEAASGLRFMRDVAKAGRGGLMAYGADIHGELNSQAYMDIMYPAGEFDSVDHRRLMAMAERTKSVIDATLYEGIFEEIENASGGNDAEYPRTIPTRPAHWATVWDTLGYTDTGFIGDYMATDLGVTGMDYEIFFNHTVPEKVWNVYLQENHINASRGIIKTAMAYALHQRDEFNARNVKVDPKGRAGYVVNTDTVAHDDENGPGRLPGPEGDGVGEDGEPVEQRPYEVSQMRWFVDTNRYMPRPFFGLLPEEIAKDPQALDQVDSLVVADTALPAAAYRNLREWVRRGGNLVLTDRSVGGLADLGVVERDAVSEIQVYLPFANFTTFDHPLTRGLRPNARQLVESAVVGYGIEGVDEPADTAPMTVVATDAWEAAGGKVLGTTNTVATGEDPAVDKELDDGSLTSVGELELGKGRVRIVGGALPEPTEANDHRYGLRNYGLTYSGLFLMENAVAHDAPGLGALRPGASPYGATSELPRAVRGRLPCRARAVKLVVKSRRPLKVLRVRAGGRTLKVLRAGRLAKLRKGRRYVVRVVARGKVVAVAENFGGRKPIRVKRRAAC